MKKNISINLQGIIFHIEDDGYDVLSRYLQEVKAHFASYQGHEEIVADIEGRIAELFAARVSPSKQVITLADVQEMTAKMGRVSDFNTTPDEDDEPAASAYAGGASQSAGFGRPGTPPPAASPRAAAADDGQPRRLYRDLAHRKIAGVCAGLAQYFLVNPLIVRLIFLAALLLPNFLFNIGHWGGFRGNVIGLGQIAFIAYVVLWIALPKRYDAPEPIDTLSNTGPLAGRKLFRDTDAGKVGGVAAGLAAYFNTDVTLIRVLLLLLLFAGGSGFIIYLVLWVVVPEARTVSEKMQMRGDAVTLSGIDSNLRTGAADSATGGRPVGTFFENAAREAQPALSFVGKVLRIMVGVLLLLMAGSMLVGFSMALGTVLGFFPHDTVQLGDSGTKYLLLHDVPTWGSVAVFLAFAVPALALLLLSLRLLLRRPLLNQSGSLLLLGLWLLGVVGSTAAVAQYAREYRTRATYASTRELAAVPGKGLVLDARDQPDEYLSQVRLRLAPADSNALGSVEQEFSARGRSQGAARLTAQSSILYTFTQQDSTLILDKGIELKEGTPFRNQQLTLTLHLPLGRVYTLTPEFIRLLDDRDFVGNNRPDTDQPYRARFTRQGRFACLNCPVSDDNLTSSDDEDDDGDEVVKFDVNGNRMRVRVNTDGDVPRVRVETDPANVNPDPAHYGTGRRSLTNPGEFKEIEAHGALKLIIRRGDTYRVEAAGNARDLRDVRMERDGDRLTLRQQSRGFLNSGATHEVLITITLPTLSGLELREACEADVSGFNQPDDLHLELHEASSARVQAQVPTLTLGLHEASHLDLSGTAQRLEAEGHEASELNARDFATERAEVSAREASNMTVHATETLDVNANGGSEVRYLGNPHVSQDLSGGSNLEQVR